MRFVFVGCGARGSGSTVLIVLSCWLYRRVLERCVGILRMYVLGRGLEEVVYIYWNGTDANALESVGRMNARSNQEHVQIGAM